MEVVLNLTSGICWGLAYLVAVQRGIKHKTWCFPKIAICQNIAWETLIVFERIISSSPFNVSFGIQLICCLLDFGILATWLVFDRGHSHRTVQNIILVLIVTAIMYLLVYVLEYWAIVAFAINLIMSVAFIVRMQHDTSDWTSKCIGICKLLGTLAATVLSGILTWNPMILWLGGLCLLFDLYYLAMLFSLDKER